MEQRSSLGLDKLYYTLVTSDTTAGYVTGTVYPLLGAKTLSYNRAGAISTVFADDLGSEQIESTGEKGLTLSVVDLLPEHEARILGRTYVNGAVQEKASDASPEIAIMGRAKMRGGKYGYFVYYKCTFMKGNSEDATQEASPSPRIVTLEGRVSDLIFNGLSREKVRDDDTNVPVARISAWFTAPSFGSVDNNALTVTAAPAAAGVIVFTFAKTGGGAVTLNQSTVINGNVIISIDSTGVITAPTWAFGVAGGATQTATASGLTSVKHDYVVTPSVRDANNIGATAKAGSVTVA